MLAWKTLVGAEDTDLGSLEGLINKAGTSQWLLNDIPWDAESVVVNSPNGPLRDLVSQAYYAELATIEACSQLLQSDIGLQAKRFIATQITDEARHAQAYLSYLNKLGGIIEIHPKMNEIFISVLKDKDLPDLCKILAVNILLEGEALNQQGKRSKVIPCPIFEKINRLILIDEARHNAFGKIFAPILVQKHTQKELAEIGTWCKSIWSNWVLANQGRYASADAQQFKVLEDELNGRWPVYEAELEKIGIIFETSQELRSVYA